MHLGRIHGVCLKSIVKATQRKSVEERGLKFTTTCVTVKLHVSFMITTALLFLTIPC